MKKYLIIFTICLLWACSSDNIKNNQNTWTIQNSWTLENKSWTWNEEFWQTKLLKEINYSNLVDKSSQEEIKNALKEAWVDEKEISEFLRNVDTFNKTVENKTLLSTWFAKTNILPAYDEDFIAQKWDEKNKDFKWNNCRITTFWLLKNFINVKNPSNKLDTENLAFDYESIKWWKIFDEKDKKIFDNFFAQIPSPNTQNTSELVKVVQDDWKKKWVEFTNPNAKVISVFLQDSIDEKSKKLFIWHVWVLLPTKDSKFIFIEKLAFQKPYQALKFDSKRDLSDYLMATYDVDTTWESARPFVLENYDLIDWYSANPNTIIKN